MTGSLQPKSEKGSLNMVKPGPSPFDESLLKLLSDRVNEPYQEKAFADYLSRGLPNRKIEQWKYSDTTHLKKWNLRQDTSLFNRERADKFFRDFSKHHFVFVLGPNDELIHQSKLPTGLTVSHTTRSSVEGHAFRQLHGAFAPTQLNFRVAAGVKLEKPLVIVRLSSEKAHQFDTSSWKLTLEEGSQAGLMEYFFSSEFHSESLQVSNCEVEVHENSILDHVRFVSGLNHLVADQDMSVSESARLNTAVVNFDIEFFRQNLNIQTRGPKAEVYAQGLYMGRDQQHIDHHTSIVHNHPEGVSHQLYKGVVTDKAKAVFNGHIGIVEKAQKIDSSQLNKNLMLSRQASVDTKPELDIYADDVKATHGATVGQLDDEHRFYLQSRGISGEMATKMLLHGFCFEVIQDIENPQLKTLAKQFFVAQMNSEKWNQSLGVL